jgi:hypothetical protein
MFGYGAAGIGRARPGKARQGLQTVARRGLPSLPSSWMDMAPQGLLWRVTAWRGEVGSGEVWQQLMISALSPSGLSAGFFESSSGMASRGLVRQGGARHGAAWSGTPRQHGQSASTGCPSRLFWNGSVRCTQASNTTTGQSPNAPSPKLTTHVLRGKRWSRLGC